uniref:ADP-ribosylation factor-related protein 1 n=1 Tax=Meloidogyne hapla TaxID=6305 RepID=A0A1I8B4B1_MELHA
MFALVKGVYEEISKRDEYFIAILGLDGAGKTTYLEMVKRLLDNRHRERDLHKITSTVGLNRVTLFLFYIYLFLFLDSKIALNEFILNLWDLGGQADLRYIWDDYIKECHATIFVVDSADSQRFDESISCLEQIVSNSNVQKQPFLVLLNKCDNEVPPLKINGYKEDSIIKDNASSSDLSKDDVQQTTLQSTSGGWQSFELDNNNELGINGDWEQNSDCCSSSFSSSIPISTSMTAVIKSEIDSRLGEVLQGDVAIFSISKPLRRVWPPRLAYHLDICQHDTRDAHIFDKHSLDILA